MTHHTRSTAIHSRELEAGRAFRLLLVIFTAALLMCLAAGCQTEPDADSAQATDEEVEDALRSARLGAVPPEVAEMISLDLGPNAVIQEDVVAQDTPTGIIYPVLYIENGEPRRVTYDRSGQRITRAEDLTETPGETTLPAQGDDELDTPPPDEEIGGTGTSGGTPR